MSSKALCIHWGRVAELLSEPSATAVAVEASERLGKVRGALRRDQLVAGRVLARRALAHETGRPATDFTWLTAPGGKPFVKSGPPVSLAHSGELVVCVVGQGTAVGIDIEQPRAGRHTQAIAANYFAPAESAWVSGSDERFYMLWVLKEAYLKARGVGLGGGLDALQCRVAPPCIEIASGGENVHLLLLRCDAAVIGVTSIDEPITAIGAHYWPSRESPPPLSFLAASSPPVTHAGITRDELGAIV